MASSALPDGWRREEIKRTKGLSTNTDVIYVSPEGHRIKSKNELAKYLGHGIDLSTFDYRSGRINPSMLRKSKHRAGGIHDHRALIKTDPSMVNPVRRVALMKQPVTVVKNNKNSKVLNAHQIRELKKKNSALQFTDPKSDNTERPFQLLWTKRLEGQRASNRALERLDDFQLPAQIRAFSLSLAKNDDIFRSITANLFFDNRPIKGQERKLLNRIRREQDEDEALRYLMAFLNPHQPMTHGITVSDGDIQAQEEIVRKYRYKLKNAIASLSKRQHH